LLGSTTPFGRFELVEFCLSPAVSLSFTVGFSFFCFSFFQRFFSGNSCCNCFSQQLISILRCTTLESGAALALHGHTLILRAQPIGARLMELRERSVQLLQS